MAMLGMNHCAFLFSLVCFLITVVTSKCPADYRYRVENCVMEAQVAPQAGGGLPLITERTKLEELCERGILQKTVDCLRDIYSRCSHNDSRKHELDMLFSIEEWKQGQELLCEDLNLFRDHFDCVSRFGPRISSCILIRTQMFRKAVTDSGIAAYKTLHDITCNFAENIVNCLKRPLARSCPAKVVDTMVTALHHFLPPACTHIGQADQTAEGQIIGHVDDDFYPGDEDYEESNENYDDSDEDYDESDENYDDSDEDYDESDEDYDESDEEMLDEENAILMFDSIVTEGGESEN